MVSVYCGIAGLCGVSVLWDSRFVWCQCTSWIADLCGVSVLWDSRFVWSQCTVGERFVWCQCTVG